MRNNGQVISRWLEEIRAKATEAGSKNANLKALNTFKGLASLNLAYLRFEALSAKGNKKK